MTPLEELLRQQIAQLENSNAALIAANAKLKGEDLIEDENTFGRLWPLLIEAEHHANLPTHAVTLTTTSSARASRSIREAD